MACRSKDKETEMKFYRCGNMMQKIITDLQRKINNLKSAFNVTVNTLG